MKPVHFFLYFKFLSCHRECERPVGYEPTTPGILSPPDFCMSASSRRWTRTTARRRRRSRRGCQSTRRTYSIRRLRRRRICWHSSACSTSRTAGPSNRRPWASGTGSRRSRWERQDAELLYTCIYNRSVFENKITDTVRVSVFPRHKTFTVAGKTNSKHWCHYENNIWWVKDMKCLKQ